MSTLIYQVTQGFYLNDLSVTLATLRKDSASDDDEVKRYFLRSTRPHGGDSPQF